MKKKIRKTVCALLMGLSLFCLIGLAGSLDCDRISCTDFVARGIAAIITLGASAWIGGYII